MQVVTRFQLPILTMGLGNIASLSVTGKVLEWSILSSKADPIILSLQVFDRIIVKKQMLCNPIAGTLCRRFGRRMRTQRHPSLSRPWPGFAIIDQATWHFREIRAMQRSGKERWPLWFQRQRVLSMR